MNVLAAPSLTIRTALVTDLPERRRVYRVASLSNAGDAPLLLAHPEFLVFGGEGVVDGRTRLGSSEVDGEGSVLGFARSPSAQAANQSSWISSWTRYGHFAGRTIDVSG